jgi:hypothetical protein
MRLEILFFVVVQIEHVHFCAESSTAAAEPPDCCPAALEGGQDCKINMFLNLFCM